MTLDRMYTPTPEAWAALGAWMLDDWRSACQYPVLPPWIAAVGLRLHREGIECGGDVGRLSRFAVGGNDRPSPHAVPILLADGPQGSLGWAVAIGEQEDPGLPAPEPHAAIQHAILAWSRDILGFDRFPDLQSWIGEQRGDSQGLSLLAALTSWWLTAPWPQDTACAASWDNGRLLPVDGLDAKLAAAQRWAIRRLVVVDEQPIPSNCTVTIIRVPADPLAAIPVLAALLGHGVVDRAAASARLMRDLQQARGEHQTRLCHLLWRMARTLQNDVLHDQALAVADEMIASVGLTNVVQCDSPHGWRTLRLVTGRITELAGPVDALVFSAFRGDYEPRPGTVLASLTEQFGIDVPALQRAPAIELRPALGVWATPAPPTMPVAWIIGVELLAKDGKTGFDLPTAIADLCTALAVLERKGCRIRSLAMAVLGSGRQGLPADQVIGVLLPAMQAHLRASPTLHSVWFVERDADKAATLDRAMDALLHRQQWLPQVDPETAPVLERLRDMLATTAAEAGPPALHVLARLLRQPEVRCHDLLRCAASALAALPVPTDRRLAAWRDCALLAVDERSEDAPARSRAEDITAVHALACVLRAALCAMPTPAPRPGSATRCITTFAELS